MAVKVPSRLAGIGRLVRAAYWPVIIGACIWSAAYIVLRVLQPYALDGFEEYELQKSWRWWQGAALYGPLGVELQPTAYPPLHYWLLGLWLGLFGPTLLAARLFSLLALALAALLGCAWLLRWTGGRADPVGERWRELIAFALLLLALHPVCGKWYELCKSDSLLVLLVAGAMVSGEHRTWRHALVSTVALVLAVLTKQNAVAFVLPLAVAHWLQGRRLWALAWPTATLALIGGCYLALQLGTGGWFFHWVLLWPAQHGMDLRAGLERLARSLFDRNGLLLVAVAAVSLLRMPRSHWTWSLLCAFGIAWLGLSKYGGVANHLYPAVWLTALLGAYWFGHAWRWALQRERWGWQVAIAATLLLAAVPGLPQPRQFDWLAERTAEWRSWLDAASTLQGPVADCNFKLLGSIVLDLERVKRPYEPAAVLHHFQLARQSRTGCPFSDQIMQFQGLVLPERVRELIASGKYKYLVLSTDPSRSPTPGWPELLMRYYRSAGQLVFDNRSKLLPEELYVRRGPPPGGGSAGVR